jgi:putative ABC transport system permease protein
MLSKLRAVGARLGIVFKRGQLEHEFDEELRFHVEELTEDNLRAGMSAEEARRRALMALGGVDKTKEEYRDALGLRLLRDFLRDFHYGLRQLRRSPGFTIVAILTLALGIGANTAIFTIVNAVLIRQLPYKDPDRLVMVSEKNKTFRPDSLQPDRNGLLSTSVPGLLDWRAQTDVFEEVGAYYWFPSRFVLTGSGEPEEIFGGRVTANFFMVLGVQPMLGRSFLPGEDRAGKNDVVLLGHGLWQRRFNQDPDIVGKPAAIDGRAYTVVGVMQPGFQFPRGEQLWTPHALEVDPKKSSRNTRNLEVVARLKAGASLEHARSVLETLAAVHEREYPDSHKDMTAAVIPLQEHMLGETRSRLLLLFGATGFVVLIACANLASMLLARGTVRIREMALRAALGAGRFRLLRQSMVETVSLALLGGTAGLLIALWSAKTLVTLGSATVPQLKDVHLDWRVLCFALGSSVVAGLISGLIPSLRASKIDVAEALKEGSAAPGALGSSRRLGGLLVVSELAAALILLTAAGLMVNTLARLYSVDLGFQPQNLLTTRITLPSYKYGSFWQKDRATRAIAFFDQTLQYVKALPGVRSAALIDALPFSGVQWGTIITVEGKPEEQFRTHTRSATPGYFQTMEIPLLRGRCFTEQDNAAAAPVAIVNDTLARQIWPDEDPIGKRVTSKPAIEVVGVVGAARHLRLDLPAGPEIYVPYGQSGHSTMFLVLRTTGDPTHLAPAVRKQIWAIDRNQPVEDVRTMEERIAGYAAPRRFYALLLGIFAGIAVVLAAVGIYGVISYSVSQRRHEIGIRMALGAERADVLHLVLGQGLMLAALGVGFGVMGGLVATRLLSTLLYGVRPGDPVTFVAVSLLLSAIAIIACYLPVHRASKVDPMVALRYE